MVREGIYQSLSTGAAYTARGVFVLRRGTFIGVGQSGAVYEGTYYLDPGGVTVTFEGCVRFEPNTPLVTGTVVGPEGLTLPFRGVAPVPRPDASFEMALDDQNISVAMKFISPLPA